MQNVHEMNKVLDKVQKLLALAQSDNVNEAALAARTAQQIMHKHNLTSYMVENFNSEKSIEEEIIDWTQQGRPLDVFNKKAATWKIHLAMIVARANHCRIYLNHAPEGSCFGLIGRESDANIVRYLYAYLVHEIHRLTKRDGKGKGRTWNNNFRIGAVREIKVRLDEAVKGAIGDVQSTSGVNLARVSTAISLMEKRGSSVEQWMNEKLNLRKAPSRKMTVNQEAQAAGKAAAREINLDNNSPTLGGGVERLSNNV